MAWARCITPHPPARDLALLLECHWHASCQMASQSLVGQQKVHRPEPDFVWEVFTERYRVSVGGLLLPQVSAPTLGQQGQCYHPPHGRASHGKMLHTMHDLSLIQNGTRSVTDFGVFWTWEYIHNLSAELPNLKLKHDPKSENFDCHFWIPITKNLWAPPSGTHLTRRPQKWAHPVPGP